jgi:hypothetical protein
MEEMVDTYLVQRLRKPYKTEWAQRVGHVFGGESKIQMSKEGFESLAGIFSFDYMGAAEYEFGTVTSCLHNLIRDRDELVSFEFTLQPKEIKPNWQRESAHRDNRRKQLAEAKALGKRAPKAKKLIPNIEPRTLFVICRRAHMAIVKDRIRELALDKIQTKRGTNLPGALDPFDDYNRETVGWLELDNGWFMFLDKEMWQKTVSLFIGSEEAQERQVDDQESSIICQQK